MTDKKTLKRQYVESASRAGVYAIRNQVSGRALVAGGADVAGILNRHRFELRHGVHRNAMLARDWAEHGEASFCFEVLDTVVFRDEPGFDVARELALLVSLWRHEVPCVDALGYGDQAAPSR